MQSTSSSGAKSCILNLNLTYPLVECVVLLCGHRLSTEPNGVLRWWRGSVVRTSDFGWRTFPDLHPIYGWHV